MSVNLILVLIYLVKMKYANCSISLIPFLAKSHIMLIHFHFKADNVFSTIVPTVFLSQSPSPFFLFQISFSFTFTIKSFVGSY